MESKAAKGKRSEPMLTEQQQRPAPESQT